MNCSKQNPCEPQKAIHAFCDKECNASCCYEPEYCALYKFNPRVQKKLEEKTMIKLGDKVRDIITGFEGVVNGRTDWLHGCTTYGLVSQELKDGLPKDSVWFDEGRLEVIPETVQTHTENHKENGGPQEAPQRSMAGE